MGIFKIMVSMVLITFVLTGCDYKPSDEQVNLWKSKKEEARLELNAYMTLYDINTTSIPLPKIDTSDLNTTKVPNPVKVNSKLKIGDDLAKTAAKYRYYDDLLSHYAKDQKNKK